MPLCILISLFSPCNPIIYYTLIYQQNCTLFYFIKNNTLKFLYCVKVLKILRHISVSSWPSSGRYLFSLRHLLKIKCTGAVQQQPAREGKQNQHRTQVQKPCFHKPKKFIFSNWRKENKYLPEDGQELTETCRGIFMTFKQYNYFNVLFLIK